MAAKAFTLKRTHWFPALVLLLGLVEVSGAMLSPVRAQESRSAEEAASLQDYWHAVEDARTPDPQAVFRDLTAITPDNSALTWDESGRVLVAVWTTWTGYAANVGGQLVLTRDLWVTAVPDLQNFCQNYAPTADTSLPARLGQVLGLPPEPVDQVAKRQIVEIWVDPQFLFRPSPDPEITDHEAELAFRTPNEFITVPLSYQHWFYAQYDQRYQTSGQPMIPESAEVAGTLPYPWTQLGYTYDWGNPADWAAVDPTRPEHVGLSEFVIHQWSPITVEAAQSVEAYCR